MPARIADGWYQELYRSRESGVQAGNFRKDIGQDIHGIRDDDIDRVRRGLNDLRRDLAQNFHIGLRQLQTRLPGLARKTGGDNNNVGVHGVLVFAGVDNGRRAERRALIDVKRLAEGFFTVDVNEKDLCCRTLNHQVVGNGSADASRADDGNFTHADFSFSTRHCLPYR